MCSPTRLSRLIDAVWSSDLPNLAARGFQSWQGCLPGAQIWVQRSDGRHRQLPSASVLARPTAAWSRAALPPRCSEPRPLRDRRAERSLAAARSDAMQTPRSTPRSRRMPPHPTPSSAAPRLVVAACARWTAPRSRERDRRGSSQRASCCDSNAEGARLHWGEPRGVRAESSLRTVALYDSPAARVAWLRCANRTHLPAVRAERRLAGSGSGIEAERQDPNLRGAARKARLRGVAVSVSDAAASLASELDAEASSALASGKATAVNGSPPHAQNSVRAAPRYLS